MRLDPGPMRPAAPADAAEMARLAGELGYPMAASEMLRRLERLLPDPHHFIAVAGSGDRLAGWMHVERRCSLEGGDRAELMGLVVDAGARRRGVGRQLLDAAENWTRAQGLVSLTVRTNIVRETSHPFYKSLGYTRSKTQHVYTKTIVPN